MKYIKIIHTPAACCLYVPCTMGKGGHRTRKTGDERGTNANAGKAHCAISVA